MAQLEKRHINTLAKLLDNYSVADIIEAANAIESHKNDIETYKKVFATDDSAVEWFKNFCARYNLTVNRIMVKCRDGQEVPYGRYVVEEMRDTCKPYFTLWIKDGHQNPDQTPHIEMGNGLEDLWWATGLQELERKMHKLCHMAGIKKVS